MIIRSSFAFRTRSQNRLGRLLQRNDRGVALVTALLLLLLMSAMALAMVISSNSDMLVNGYYRNFRGSFYAADSGLSIARQDMVTQLLAAGNTKFHATTQPIPAGTENIVKTSINTKYGAAFQTLNAGQAASSWPEKYMLDTTGTVLSAPTCSVLGGGGTCAAPTGTVTGFSYLYSYSLRALGRSSGNQVTSISDSGTIKINVTGVAGSSSTSFAAYGMFIDQYSICDGSTLVPGTITGPVFTNGAWNFGSSGNYIFSDTVGSVSANAGYQYSDGTCHHSPSTTDKYKNTTISPQFQSGLNMNQSPVPLPPNDYNQKRAVLDGKGVANTAVTNSELNNDLKSVSKAPYPLTGASSGVYLPYTVDPNTGAATFNGGGIYVEGDASVTLSTSGKSGQVYTVTQNGTTTTITIDPVANTTTVSSNGTQLSISGVPNQLDPTSGSVQRDATMLYVDGNITSLSGPGQGQPAISDSTALTITAANNVTVTGDILYNTPPVTMTQNQIPGTPADTLVPGNDHGQVLGIFTAKGDIQLNNTQSNGNLEIDASLATISQGGTGGLVNVGKSINTLSIVGGRIQNDIKNINTTTRNVFFDRRFAQNNFSPPWYPSTTLASTAPTSAQYVPTVQRLKWINNTTYY
jgi:Tfp pilus assembly protein PilX